jgi:cell division septation protein DedD
MKFKEIYIIGVLVSLYFFGCSSGEYELEKKTVKYTEKQLVYDTIKAVDNEIKTDTSTQVITKDDNFTFIVQIGAFINKNNFDRFFEASRASLGNDVYFEQIEDTYVIRIGRFNNNEEALKMLEYVKSKGYSDAFVIKVRNQN